MRDLFPGYYKPTKDQFESIWKKGLFIFDTNVLLDIYRYSEETVETLFTILEKLDDRIWIPYQVCKEYHKNLNSVISEQVKKYHSSIKTLEEFQGQINEKRNHPFLTPKQSEEIKEFCIKFNRELEQKQNEVKSLIHENPTKEKLADLLTSKVGTAFTQKELEGIYNEGKDRYQNQIPPGYKDKGAKPGNEIYGDLVLWKEILRKSKNDKLTIIFVTGDRKEDWFTKHMGMTIGPRPELIDEFHAECNQHFYCYPTDSFLKYANEYLDIPIAATILEEVEQYIDREVTTNQTSSGQNTQNRLNIGSTHSGSNATNSPLNTSS